MMTMPTFERGDYVKVEFPDETTGIGEWMLVRVHHCDDEKQLVFGTLDNEPVNDYDGKIGLGSELAVNYSQVREHRKPSEFTKQPFFNLQINLIDLRQCFQRVASEGGGQNCTRPAQNLHDFF
jgi:hypothetical protein